MPGEDRRRTSMSDKNSTPTAPPDTVLLSPDGSPDPKPANTPAASESPDGANDELSLVDLLLQASDTIRAERARSDAVEAENAVLRAQLDGVRAAFYRAAAQRTAASAPLAAGEDALTLYVAQHLLAAEVAGAGRAGSAAASSSSSAPRAGSRGSVTAATQSYRQGWEAAATANSATTQHVDPTSSPGRSPPAAPPEAVEPSAALEDDALGGAAAAHSRSQHTSAAPTASVQAMASRLRRALAPRPATAVMGDIIHTMVTALQRDVLAALATQGTRSTPLNRLRGFAMVRLRPCVYQLLVGPPAEVTAKARGTGAAHGAGLRRSTSPLTATPYRHDYLLYQTSRSTAPPSPTAPARVHTVVVHLTIDSGALRVVRGGGHVDFVEYLERLLHIHLGEA